MKNSLRAFLPSPDDLQPPRWLHGTGGAVGLLGGFLIALNTVLGGFQGVWMLVTFQNIHTLAWALIGLGGLVGILSARWCWWFAFHNAHPLLTRLETWLPLRGKWLVFGIAGLMFPLHWAVLMLLLYPFSLVLPCLAPFVLLALGVSQGKHMRDNRDA